MHSEPTIVCETVEIADIAGSCLIENIHSIKQWVYGSMCNVCETKENSQYTVGHFTVLCSVKNASKKYYNTFCQRIHF